MILYEFFCYFSGKRENPIFLPNNRTEQYLAMNGCKIKLSDKTHSKTLKKILIFQLKIKSEFHNCYLLITFLPTDKTSQTFNINKTDVTLSNFKKKLK